MGTIDDRIGALQTADPVPTLLSWVHLVVGTILVAGLASLQLRSCAHTFIMGAFGGGYYFGGRIGIFTNELILSTLFHPL